MIISYVFSFITHLVVTDYILIVTIYANSNITIAKFCDNNLNTI